MIVLIWCDKSDDFFEIYVTQVFSALEVNDGKMDEVNDGECFCNIFLLLFHLNVDFTKVFLGRYTYWNER